MLLSEVATIVSDLRYMQALTTFNEVPEIYFPARYGPPRDDAAEATEGEGPSEAEKARAVAASMR
ncbi:hypothetical protein SAMN04488548_12622 [Gordonia westfalica]|nr:hypothetical protein SAMN04488548_1044 [Gordonia westfalica]SDT88522.1 hypothetical protein SAMN04488548_12622 [Gordonia westfalica]